LGPSPGAPSGGCARGSSPPSGQPTEGYYARVSA
jgi:hypothetical protein